jgi:DNA repair protein RecO (recombination protein O)
MIVKTEAIVLKKLNFRDTSRIVNLLTKDFGRLSIIAKGARDPKSRFGPILDTFNHLQIVIYRKEGRDLHLLSQCDLLTRFAGLTGDLDRLAAAMSVLDLVSATSQYGEENRALFGVVMESFRAIDAGNDPQTVLLYFQSRLLCLLGFQPDLSCCTVCKMPVDPTAGGTKQSIFRLTADGILCPNCSPIHMLRMNIRSEALSFLRDCQQMAGGWRTPGSVSPDARKEALTVLSGLLGNHVEEIRNMKSGSVLASIVEQR